MSTRLLLAAAIAAIMSGASADPVVWSGDVIVPANEDVTCTDLSAITSLEIGSGATVRFTTATAPNFLITGAGTVVKESAGDWTMTTSIPDYQGNYEIAAGTVSSGILNAFGMNGSAYKLTVKGGATLVITGNDGSTGSRVIHLAGDGAPGRKGAIEMPATVTTSSLWPRFYLDDDATMYMPAKSLFFIDGLLDLNNHRFTVVGSGNPTIMGGCTVSATGEVYLKTVGDEKPTLTMRSWSHANPGFKITPGEGPFVLTGGNKLSFYCGVKPVERPLWLSGTNTLEHTANASTGDQHYYATNHANWAGPVVFTNETGMSVLNIANAMPVNASWPATCMLCVSGPISGNGTVKTSNGGVVTNRVAILNAANSYTGGTYINNGAVGGSSLLGYPGSIPNENYASVTCNYGFVDLALADDYSRWGFDSASRFANNVTVSNSCRPRFSSEFTTNGIGPVKFQLAEGTSPADTYFGARDAVRFEGVGNETPIPFRWYGGTAYLAGPQPIYLGETRLRFPDANATSSSVRIVDGADVTLSITNTLFIGSSGSQRAKLVVSNAVLKNSDVMKSNFSAGGWAGLQGGSIFAGYYSPGILEVLDGALISNRVIVCGYAASGCWEGGSYGAVYQRGGHVVALGATESHKTSGVGLAQGNPVGGYYELTGGFLESRGRFLIGGYGYGCFAQYGGKVLITNRLDQTDIGSTLTFAACNQGHGSLYIKKGSWDVYSSDLFMCTGTTDTPMCELTLDGDDAEFDLHSSGIFCAYASSFGRYNINLNGGVLRSAGLRLYGHTYGGNAISNNVLCVNFNGGTFKTGAGGVNIFGLDTADRSLWATNVAVYKGGMTIDTDGKAGNRIDTPVRGAYGKGVKSITLSAPISGTSYITSPRVRIEGDGIGAAAFAHFDSTNMVVDRIVVTSPGCGYTTATAKLIFRGNVEYADVTCTVELEDNENTGDFTKKGDGALTLNATNTWGGATTVLGGTLKAGCDWAIPTNSAVKIGGGATLNLNGKEAKISSVEYLAGGGQITNGGAAELPASFSMRMSVDDIIAGNAIELTGSQDLSGITLTVDGDDYSALDENVRRYNVLKVSGGTLTGAPTISAAAPPTPWQYTVRGDGVVLQYVKGTTFVFR